MFGSSLMFPDKLKKKQQYRFKRYLFSFDLLPWKEPTTTSHILN